MADVAAEAPLVQRKAKKGPRVERRGRFTITDIEPDSPASATMTVTMAYADGDARDSVADEEDAASGDHHESGEDGDVEGDDEDTNGAADGRRSLLSETATTSERISPFGSAVFERSTSVSTVRVVDENTEPSGLEAVLDGESEDHRVRSPTIDETPDNRRVKRKGRFTIIELSSDSPRSRRNSAEEFSNTTSISVTSAQVTQANAQSQSSSPVITGAYAYVDTSNGTSASAVFARRVSENNTASTRTSRSMVEASRRGRENEPRRANYGSSRRSSARMRSVSPLRERGSTNGSSSSSRHHLSSSYGSTPSTPFRARTFDPLHVTTSPYLKPKLSPSSNGVSTMSLSSSYSSVSGTTPTASVTPTNGSSVEKRYELGANRRHLASRQKAITISAEQFIQQQHTIASLIRQQQDLKQLIGVLAEQQQHLVSMPKQLADFRLDQTQSDVQEDTMQREVQLQVGALSRANEALQKLLSEAEQDASERTMEIECLSNENNELRYRFSHMERRYHEEKKRSFALEQELQRTRRALHAARQKDKNDVQKQHQKLSTRVSSRELEDPIEKQAPVAKLLP